MNHTGYLKPTVLGSFCSLPDIPFLVALVAQIRDGCYTFCSGCLRKGWAGERIRGNSPMVTIRPVLHTGQRQGLTPVSLSNRSILVSGGFGR
jgi:hypothetical protein